MSDTPESAPEGDLRRRLRELLAVPERDRTDAQWDELIEIEVRLAPGNRLEAPRRGDAPPSPNQGRQGQGPRKPRTGGPRPQGKKPNRPPR
jgi:hypothetical protein